MNITKIIIFIKRQITDIQNAGINVFIRKSKRALILFTNLPLYIVAIPFLIVIRSIRPWLLIRFGELISSRIGHFAANTELYFCERDAGINVPNQHYLDIFYMPYKPICNRQLKLMWKRIMPIWPAFILKPLHKINRMIPGGDIHEVGNNTSGDRDVHNLLDRSSPHLEFTENEKSRGESGLRNIGIPVGARFVCLAVRDSAYLDMHLKDCDFSYHNYRDSNIQNYILAAEYLASRGYYVVRMGAKVKEPMKCNNPKIIDYATNGMRSDFMDIYLGAKCAFCISVGTGFDAIPQIFRRPIAYVNLVPVGYFHSYVHNSLGIFKHHVSREQKRELSLSEIFKNGIGFCAETVDYENKNIILIENTPEEIRCLVREMVERMENTWRHDEKDECLQELFWNIFPVNSVSIYNGTRLHGQIHARCGAEFLRNNIEWLQ